MGVDVLVGERGWEIGASDFFHAFFSTVSYHLEPDGWGSQFPMLMNEFYQGRLPASHAKRARKELAKIHGQLSSIPPTEVVWDIEDRSKRPPWGDEISAEITSLANYFVTSNGKDLFEILEQALAEAERIGEDVVIQ